MSCTNNCRQGRDCFCIPGLQIASGGQRVDTADSTPSDFMRSESVMATAGTAKDSLRSLLLAALAVSLCALAAYLITTLKALP